jgi:hypothetical protein
MEEEEVEEVEGCRMKLETEAGFSILGRVKKERGTTAYRRPVKLSMAIRQPDLSSDSLSQFLSNFDNPALTPHVFATLEHGSQLIQDLRTRDKSYDHHSWFHPGH